ncbi:MAG: 2-oxoacid:acceptor oxidoreductase family protein [Candidatus Bathyarchaeota archaeon]
MMEIRIHGRGGQGAVTAAKILGEAAITEGKWAWKSALYGGERRGAPVQAFVRIADEPIRETHQVIEPDCLLIIDSTLPDVVNVTAGLKEPGVIIYNTTKKPEEVGFAKRAKVATLDALTISNELFGVRSIPIVNTSMMGALVKATGYLELESLFEPIMKSFPGSRGEKNIQAVKLGYENSALST